MVSFSLPNFITVGLIAVFFLAVFRGGAKLLGKTSPV